MDRYQARRVAVPALIATGAFGFHVMFGQLYRNGYVDHVTSIIASPKPTLPGSDTPLLTYYLGIPAVDKLFTLAAVLWCSVTDGSSPALSLYMVQFGGQLVPIFLAMMIEGSRSGNAKNALFFSISWGYLMQAFGYAATMPIYALVHLFTSPAYFGSGKQLARAVIPQNRANLSLSALVPAFVLGYFLPSVLMSWPVSSSNLHQWFGAIWQGFPLYVVVFQQVFGRLAVSSSQSDTVTLRQAYEWAFKIATVTQIFAYTVILAAKLFPGVYPPWAAREFTFAAVFLPSSHYSTEPLSSTATAMHDFFRWDQYVGSAAALTWGMVLDITARKEFMSWGHWAFLGGDILRWSVLAGPGGALMRLLQRRDTVVLQQAQDEVRRQ